jgi:hypothetical protein
MLIVFGFLMLFGFSIPSEMKNSTSHQFSISEEEKSLINLLNAFHSLDDSITDKIGFDTYRKAYIANDYQVKVFKTVFYNSEQEQKHIDSIIRENKKEYRDLEKTAELDFWLVHFGFNQNDFYSKRPIDTIILRSSSLVAANNSSIKYRIISECELKSLSLKKFRIKDRYRINDDRIIEYPLVDIQVDKAFHHARIDYLIDDAFGYIVFEHSNDKWVFIETKERGIF